MNKKMKHVLLALCVCIFGLMMTGCGSAINTTVKLTSATKATIFSAQVLSTSELLRTLLMSGCF